MYIQLLRQIATAILPLVLLINCYVITVAANSKRSKSAATAERKNARSSSEKSSSDQKRKERSSKTARTNDNRDKASSKKRAAEAVTTRESKLAKKRRAAEARRAEEKRRAEAARLAAIARNEELRERVQSMIAKDDLTGEDPEIRRVALNALGNHAGTVVVMNPQTGRVYSIVNQQWALREGFKPCSTIKLVTTVAGLNEAVIDPNDTTKISDTNQVSLTRALAYSTNPYFQTVGEQVGFEKMVAYARQLGLGEKTGINGRNEFQGRVPGADSFRAIHRMSSHGDHYEVTALQLATLVSAIGNGGKLLRPYIVRSRQDENKFKTKVRREINVGRDVWGQVVPGMVGAVNYGSGKRAQDPQQQVAGKTGTCIEDGTWVGLFTSYAPVLNPKLAVVVITRGADARGHFPAAVAGRIYRELANPHGAPAGLNVASSRGVGAVGTDDEEETVLEEEAEYEVQTATVYRSDQSKPSKVKPVLMSIPVPRQMETPSTRPNDEPVVTGGQTRPRRVLGE